MLDGKDPTPEEMSQWFDEVLGSKPKSNYGAVIFYEAE